VDSAHDDVKSQAAGSSEPAEGVRGTEVSVQPCKTTFRARKTTNRARHARCQSSPQAGPGRPGEAAGGSGQPGDLRFPVDPGRRGITGGTARKVEQVASWLRGRVDVPSAGSLYVCQCFFNCQCATTVVPDAKPFCS